MNGSGTTNQATDTAQSLKALGFNIGTLGDTTPVGREAETVVYYSSKSHAEMAAAQAVANAMTGAVILADDPTQVKPGSQVTVVTGTDFTRQPAAGARERRRIGGEHGERDVDDGRVGLDGVDGVGVFELEQRRLPAPDLDGDAARSLGSPLVHAQGGRGHVILRRTNRDRLTAPDMDPGRGPQAKISPPLVSRAWPVMADERSEAR